MPDSDRPVRKKHRLDASAYSQTDSAYFLTICARYHGAPFASDALASAVVDSLLWTRERYRWSLYAYCLMPDHLHFLAMLNSPAGLVNHGSRRTQPEGILDHVARFKSFTTQLSWKHGLEGVLWQRSSYESVLDIERPIDEVANYILGNPVRKGLIAEGEVWKHAGRPDPL